MTSLIAREGIRAKQQNMKLRIYHPKTTRCIILALLPAERTAVHSSSEKELKIK